MDAADLTHRPFGLPVWPQPPPGHGAVIQLVNPAPRLLRGAALFAGLGVAGGAFGWQFAGWEGVMVFGAGWVLLAAFVLAVALRHLGRDDLQLVLDAQGLAVPRILYLQGGVQRVAWADVASATLLLENQHFVGRIEASDGRRLRIGQDHLPPGWDVRDLLFRVEVRASLARRGHLSEINAAVAEALVIAGRPGGAVWVIEGPDGVVVEAILDPERGELLLRGAELAPGALDPDRGALVVRGAEIGGVAPGGEG